MPRQTQRWAPLIFEDHNSTGEVNGSRLVGVLEGEGIGQEIIAQALTVLSALESASGIHFEVRRGGATGVESRKQTGRSLNEDVVVFCEQIFSEGGAVLAGPAGGRFVYDLRKRFDLFCKLSPVFACDGLANIARLKPEFCSGVDIVVVRENVAGIYQGDWSFDDGADGRLARHSFSYSEEDARRILRVAASIALERRRDLRVVVKADGIPTVSQLWADCAADIAAEVGVNWSTLDGDYAAYLLVQEAQNLDVVVAPNLFGDVLSDVGGVLLGSRALSFSGNFSGSGAAVYQTNHGAAWDLSGSNRANPTGQIFALAMMLRESFGLCAEATLIENAVAEVWKQGWRTVDLAEKGCRAVTTQEMGERVVDAVLELADRDG